MTDYDFRHLPSSNRSARPLTLSLPLRPITCANAAEPAVPSNTLLSETAVIVSCAGEIVPLAPTKVML